MNPAIELKARRIALWLLVCYIIETSLLKTFLKQPRVGWQLLSDLLIALAISVCIIGGVESIRAYDHNAHVNAMASRAVETANQNSLDHKSSQTLQPGAAPSTIKPSTVSSGVAPNLPAGLIIPKIGVNTSVVTVGLASDGSIGTPSNVFQAAWYNGSRLPNQEGATLIDGHISSWTSEGVFYNLDKLDPGDLVQVQLGSGQIISYTVVKTVVYPSGNVDMSSVLSPFEPNTKALNLISCFGDVIAGTSQFNERIVVYTEQQ